MIIYNITKTSDSDNTYCDGDYVSVIEDGAYVEFKLTSPDRKFSVRYEDLFRILKAWENDNE